MKYFTESIFSKVLPVVVCLFVFNLFVVSEVEGQTPSCSFDASAATTISTSVTAVADKGTITFSTLNSNLGQACADNPTAGNTTNHLWIKYNVLHTTTMDEQERVVYLGEGGATPSGSDVFVTCIQNLNLVDRLQVVDTSETTTMTNEVEVPSGSMVSFFSAPEDLTNADYRPTNDSRALEFLVTLTILDDDKPMVANATTTSMTPMDPVDYAFPSSIEIECLEDTSTLNMMSLEPNTVMDNTTMGDVALYPTIFDCSGISDTSFTQTFEHISDLTGKQVLRITRTWVFTDNAIPANISDPITQTITVVDNAAPVWMNPAELAPMTVANPNPAIGDLGGVDTTLYELAGNPIPDNDPNFVNADILNWDGQQRLHVFLEMNDPNYAKALDYWTNDYLPTPVDVCFGGDRDTLDSDGTDISINSFVTEVAGFPSIIDYSTTNNVCRDLGGFGFDFNNSDDNMDGTPDDNPNVSGVKMRVQRRFFAVDSVENVLGIGADNVNGNTGAGSEGRFLLNIFGVDATPPVVDANPAIFNDADAVINPTDNTEPDTIAVFVSDDDAATCVYTLSQGNAVITATDAISGAVAAADYSFMITSVESNSNTALPVPFTATGGGDNAADGDFPVGRHTITYTFDDECLNRGTYTFVLKVQNREPVLTDGPNLAAGVALTETQILNTFDGYNPDMTNTGLTKVDTFILFNDATACHDTIAATDFEITAIDAGADTDPIEYEIIIQRIDLDNNGNPANIDFGETDLMAGGTAFTLTSGTTITAGFDTDNNRFSGELGVGQYKIRYTFQDRSTCPEDASVEYVVIVQDTSENRVTYSPGSPFDSNDSLSIIISETNASCTRLISYTEPDYTNYQNCAGGGNATFIRREVVSGPEFDNFGGQPTANANRGKEVDAVFPVGVSTIRYYFADALGGMDSTDLKVNIIDTFPPEVVLPDPIVALQRNPANCKAAIPDYRDETMDNCIAGLVVTQVPAPSSISGDSVTADTKIVITATDGSGNVDKDSFTVTLADLAPQPLEDLSQMPITVNCSVVRVTAPYALVNCTQPPIQGFPISGGQLVSGSDPVRVYEFTGSGTITILWQYVSTSTTAPAQQTQNINFLPDNVKPEVRVHKNVVISPDTLGRVIFAPSALDSLSSDNCTDTMNLEIFTKMDTLMNCDSIGETFDVFLYVRDEAGNLDSLPSSVTVMDTLAPIFIDSPSNDTLMCVDLEDIPAAVLPAIMDNCSSVGDSVWVVETNNRPDTSSMVDLDSLQRDFDYFNYTVTRTFFARDGNDNIDSIKQTIMVQDETAPNIPYGDTVFVDSDANITNCSAIFSVDLRAQIIEGCTDTAIIAVDFYDNNGFVDTTSLNLNILMGMDSIRIRAEDAIGNADTQKIILVVRDRTAPTAVCKDASVSVNALGLLIMDEQIINGGSFDNCVRPLTFSFSQDTFDCSDVGLQQVIMTVTDEEGNSSTCQSDITIQDFTGSGSLSCPDPITIACDASTDPANTGSLSVSNICQRGVEIEFNDIYKAAPANNSNICQIIERNWMLIDTASGTVTTCTQLISLVDDEAPTFDATFADVTVDCIDDATTADSILVKDNCADDVYVQAVPTITIGTNRITLRKIWTATDSCNITVDTQMIIVTDVVAPAIALPVANDTFVYNTADYVPDSCGVLIPAIDFNQYVTDCNSDLGLRIELNRAGSSTMFGPIYSEYLPVGNHAMELIATDTSGNVGRKNFVISINDTSKPTVVCVGNRTISLGEGGTGVLTIDDVFSSATDNCSTGLDTSDARLSKSVFDCSDLGMQTVTLFVTDAAGNEGACTVDVNVINNGSTDVIDITTSATSESIGGAGDGSVSVAVNGGSGNYTYLWTPGNATTATVNNLAAGLYTVIVSDEDTGCRLTDTARVAEGVTINYTLGNDNGNSGEIIQIPVVVSNFDSVAGFSMTFRLNNTNVAQFVNGNEAGGFAFPGLANAFQFQNVGELDVFVSNSQGVTLADGSTLFFINVRLTGTAGQTVELSANPLNTSAIETIIILDGMTTGVTSSTSSVTITVGDGTNTATTFSGNISTVANNPLPDVTVTLSGDATGTDVTNAAGDYTFAVTTGQSLTVTPAEDRQHNQGLRVTDLAIIQNHILGNVAFTSPYQYIAADVNDNQLITVTDLAEIQAVILGIRTEFFTAPSWKFVPDDFAITLSDPFANPIPSSISTISENADFTAVKMGDVDYTASTVNLQTTGEAKSRETFRFGIEDRALKAGEIIEVPFKADNFQEMYAYQLTLNANPEWLSFEGIQAGELADINLNNFGLQDVERGLISTLWFAAEPQNIEQNATLFTISFRVNKGGRNLSDILRASSDRLDAAAYATDAQPRNISLAFDKHTALEGFELFQNKPNPFSAQTTISFSVPKATAATLRFYDFSGRRVHQIKGDFAQGMNNVVVHKNELAGSGVLYYEIETPGFTARKKMIVLD